MKRIITIFMFVLSLNFAFSQTNVTTASSQTSGYLSKWDGNYSITGSVAFESSSKIGIGTTSPSSTLDVQSSSTSEASVLRIINSNGSGSYQTSVALNLSHFGGTYPAAKIVEQEDNNGSYDGSLQFYTRNSGSDAAPSERLRITSGGNIGIGTTTIGSKLQINGNTAIGYSSSTSAPSNGLCVSGNVGIGITSPYEKLQVVGNSVFTSTTSSITSAAYIRGLNNYSTASTPDFTWYNNDQTGIYHPASNTISFSINGSEKMRINSDGYIGIGWYPPDAKLDIRGSSGYTLKIVDGNQGAGRILVSDANGVASWSSGTNSQAWCLTGNSGTSAGSNFIGTTDNQSLMFKTGSVQSGIIDIDYYNAFWGYASGINNDAGYQNTGIGKDALYTNTNGYDNTACGYQALKTNSTGFYNTAMGAYSLFSNTGYANSSLGYYSLFSNSSGDYNTGVGIYSLYHNTTGDNNTAIGDEALYSNTTGGNNTAVGAGALFYNTTHSHNTALGGLAGYYNHTYDYCTFIGYMADMNSNYNYSTAIGYGATIDGTNRIKLGNDNADVYCYDNAWAGSDGRFKINVQENVKGLDFINRLRPITYQMDTKALDDYTIKNMPDSIKTLHQEGMDFAFGTEQIHSGFIAQEVEQAANDAQYTSTMVHVPSDSNDIYYLSYAEFVVPLVKAVQELSTVIDSLKNKQKISDSLLTAIQNCCAQGISDKNIQNNGTQLPDNSQNALQIELSNNSQPILYQNEPNPFDGNTVIRYFLPENTSVISYIIFYDIYGKEIKEIELTTKGFGTINANTVNLSSGIYSYSLMVNNTIIDTKKMIKGN